MSDTGLEFPPFVPAKPKDQDGKGPRTRKSAKSANEIVSEAMEATGGEKKRRKKRKPRPTTIPLDALPAFSGLTTEEAEQVVTIVEALQTFAKGSRTRIATALGKIFA